MRDLVQVSRALPWTSSAELFISLGSRRVVQLAGLRSLWSRSSDASNGLSSTLSGPRNKGSWLSGLTRQGALSVSERTKVAACFAKGQWTLPNHHVEDIRKFGNGPIMIWECFWIRVVDSLAPTLMDQNGYVNNLAYDANGAAIVCDSTSGSSTNGSTTIIQYGANGAAIA